MDVKAGALLLSAVVALRQAGEISCQPSLPYFCSNIHVTCVSPTSVKTFPFRLRATPAGASIESASDAQGILERYAGARVEWEDGGASVIFRPRLENGYVRLLPDGTYIFRHYAQNVGTMSRGQCH